MKFSRPGRSEDHTTDGGSTRDISTLRPTMAGLLGHTRCRRAGGSSAARSIIEPSGKIKITSENKEASPDSPAPADRRPARPPTHKTCIAALDWWADGFTWGGLGGGLRRSVRCLVVCDGRCSGVSNSGNLCCGRNWGFAGSFVN